MSTTGGKILHVLESLVLALFLTIGTYMLIMFITMLFAKGPGDGEMFIVGLYTMPLYPFIFAFAFSAGLGATGGRRRARIASMVLIVLNLLVLMVGGWIKSLFSA